MVPAFLWGVAFANIVRGVPIGPDKEFTGTLFDLHNPYALLGGVVTLVLFTFHGAVFVALKTVGDIRERARRFATGAGLATAVVALVFLVITQVEYGRGRSLPALIVAVAALVVALAFNLRGREGWAFTFSGITIVAAVAMLFLALFPNVMPSTTNAAWSLTVDNAASTPYTLKIMSWVAVVMTPIVLAYQGWTYWVFRKRIGVQNIPKTPVHGAADPT